MNAPECVICAEPYTKSVRSCISCPYCHFDACRKCCERYILDEPFPKCMNTSCGKEWTRLFVSTAFTKQFVANSLKQRRQEVLFEKEQSLFPATQLVIENEKVCRTQMAEVDRELATLYEQTRTLTMRRSEIMRNMLTLSDEPSAVEETARRRFVRACPADHCRGFLSSQWKCGICDQWTCPDCHALKGAERNATHHVCNPDDIASAQAIARDSKPCPKCASLIFKIDGCDQMWCIECKTGFSWRTGRIEERIHNPHYFEWLHRTGGQDPRVPANEHAGCRRRVLNTDFSIYVRRRLHAVDAPAPIGLKIMSAIQSMIHLHTVVMERYTVTNEYRRNLELRMQYMKGNMNESTFKDTLQKDNKRHEKMREMREILDLVIVSATDILYRFYDGILDMTPVDWQGSLQVFTEIGELLKYADECLASISKAYSSTQYCIRMRYEGRWAYQVLCNVRFVPSLAVKTAEEPTGQDGGQEESVEIN